MKAEQLTFKEKLQQRCVHFTGVQHWRCKAGVEYKTAASGQAHSLPCLQWQEAPIPCPQFQSMSDVKIQELVEQIESIALKRKEDEAET